MLSRVLTGLLALGVSLAPVLASAADPPKPFLGVVIGPADVEKDPSPVIRAVDENGPASKAGLQKGDVILKVGESAVKTAEDVVTAVSKAKPGEKLSVVINRSGKEETIAVTVGERTKEAPFDLKRHPLPGGAVLGVWTQPVTPELKEKLGLAADKGALVVAVTPGSPAAKAGLAKDDLITAVNDQPVAHPSELRRALEKIGAGREATLKFLRGKEAKEVKAQLEESRFGFLSDFEQLKQRFNGEMPAGFHAEWQQRLEELDQRFRELLEPDPPSPAK